jgi:hypothetical protein
MAAVFGQKQSPEELKEVRQARTEYQNTLSQTQTNVNADVNGNKLTPESGQAVLEKVKEAYEWLEKNPNSPLSGILANQDSTMTEIKRIIAIDKPKREFKNSIMIVPTLADDLEVKKRINAEQQTKLKAFAKEEEAWYAKFATQGTDLDFSQETIKLRDTITSIVPDNDVRAYIMGEIDRAKQMSPDELIGDLNKTKRDITKKQAQDVNVKEGVSVIMKTATSVFISLLVIALCITAGSIAANTAIGREPAYRVLYFIYGALPIFAPIMLIYALYNYFRGGPFQLYGILPISTEAATTRLGKILMYPFYWVPDHESVAKYDEWQEILKKAIPA